MTDILNSGSSLILIDSDHYWTKSPLTWLDEQRDFDLLGENNEMPQKRIICAGFLFLNSTIRMRQLWSKIDKHTMFFQSFPETKYLHEQNVLNRALCNLNKSTSVSSKKCWEELEDDHLLNFWKTADYLFPAPENIKWDFIPEDIAVAGEF